MKEVIGNNKFIYPVEQEMLGNANALKKQPETADIGSALLGATRDFYDRGDKELDSVLSTVCLHTKMLDYPAMRRILKTTENSFDLADLKRKPEGLSIYLCLPASRIGQCNRWFRIFINQLLATMGKKHP